MKTTVAWRKKIAIIVVVAVLGLLGSSLLVRAYYQHTEAEENRWRLFRAGSRLGALVEAAGRAFERAAESGPAEHITNIRIAAVNIGKAQAVIPRVIEAGKKKGIDATVLEGFAKGLSAEDLAQYLGPGIDAELDRKLSVLMEQTHMLRRVHFPWLLFEADQQEIQDAFNSIQLLPVDRLPPP